MKGRRLAWWFVGREEEEVGSRRKRNERGKRVFEVDWNMQFSKFEVM